MSDIELVVKIPEEIYKASQIIDVKKEDVIQIPLEVIANATPLPKGHGRLGDLDALEKEMTNGIKAGNYEEGYETFAHINDMDDCLECVKYAETIIEADEAESEEKMIYTGKKAYDPLTDTYSTGYWIKDSKGYWYPVWRK